MPTSGWLDSKNHLIMARKRKSKLNLPRIEILIIGIFFLSFTIWAASKCNATKKIFQQEDDNEIVQADTTALTPAAEAKPFPKSDQSTLSPITTSGGAPRLANPQYSKLYVLIDDLNLRTGPSRDSSVITTIPINEEVYFLNQVSDSTEQINMGTYIANEPWVKIRSLKGHEGWVYGAGVHYYIRK